MGQTKEAKLKPEDYELRVQAGPDYDESKYVPVKINEEHTPQHIDSPYFVGFVCVRVLNYNGSEGEENPTSEYFKGRNRRYSIMLQG